MKKKIISLAVGSLSVASLFAMTSCTNTKNAVTAESIIKNLIFQEDGTVVTEAFTVASTMSYKENEYNLLWSSSNTDLVKISEEAVNNAYEVLIERPDSEKTEVKITAELTVGKTKATKEFKIFVTPYDVYDFSGSFKWDKAGALVDADFELPQETAIGDKKATIKWQSTNTDLVAISEDGKTANVVPSSPEVPVELRATFTYHGETTVKKFTVKVSRPMTDYEKLVYWYNNTGITQTLSGYVLAVAAEYSSSYGNVSLYILDDTGRGGYYLYRTKCDKTEGPKIQVGSHVTVTGQANTYYNGLMETSAGGSLVVDDVPALTAEQIKEKTYAMDNDLVANAESLLYRTSSYVSLSGWKVESKADGKKGETTTVLTLSHSSLKNVKISVVVSKYVQNMLDENNVTAVNTALAGLNVGDFVDVRGILSYTSKNGFYEQGGYQILLTDAADIVKAEAESAAKNDAKSVATAISKLKLTDVYQNKEIALPATQDGCTVEWSVSGPEGYSPRTAKIEDGKLVVTPDNNVEEFTIVATVTKGDYSTEKRFNIRTVKKSDQELVDEEVAAFELSFTEPGEYELLETAEIYGCVGLSYEIVEGKATVDGKDLFIASCDETSTIKIKAKFTCGEATGEKVFEITVTNQPVVQVETVTAPVTDTEYTFFVYQGNKKENVYFDGTISSKYLGSTTDPTKAVKVKVTKTENDKYTLSFTKDDKVQYIGLKEDNGALIATLSETPYEFSFGFTEKGVTYNSFYGSLTTTKDGADVTTNYYLGTYSSYTTISASKTSYAASSFVGYVANVTSNVMTTAAKVALEKESLTVANGKTGATVALPTANVAKDVKITYTVKEGDPATVTDGKITYGKVYVKTTVTLTATLTCGDSTDTKELTVEVLPVEFKNVTDAVKDKTDGDEINITGVVTSINTTKNYCWISDGTTSFEVYGALAEGSIGYDALAEGDVINVSGKYKLYGTTHETQAGAAIYAKTAATDAQKAAITLGELKVSDYETSAADVALKTQGTTFATENTVVWTVKSGTAATITDGKLTIVAPAAGDDVVLTATATFGETVVSKDFAVHVFSDEERANKVAADIEKALTLGLVTSTETVDFSKLPSYATVSITVAEGATSLAYDAEAKKLTVTAGATKAEEKVTFTVTVGEFATTAKEMTIESEALPQVVINATVITNTTYAAATSTAGDMTYATENSMKNGKVLQFKKHVDNATDAYIKTNTAFSKDIVNLIVFFGSNGGDGTTGGKAYASNLVVEVSKSADFAAADTVVLTGTVDGSNVTYTVTGEGYVYFRITNTSTYAVYLNSITVTTKK